jgi:hypothetical protein
MNISSKLTLKELKQIAKNKNFKNYSNLNKKELLKHIGGDGFFSGLKSYVPTLGFSKSSQKIQTPNGEIGIGYNPSNLKLPATPPLINKVNTSPIKLDIQVTNFKNNIVNKTNKLKQILNMNNSDATIYFSEDIIKKLINFELELIKDNIKEIETMAQISSFIRYEDLLTVNKNSIDKMIADINASYLMKGTNYKLIQLTAILVKNLKDLKKLISIKNLKNSTLQKNINSFSSNNLKNYIKKISSNITPTSNMKTIQRKMKIRNNLQQRLTKLPKENTILSNSSKEVTFRNKNGISSLTNVKLIPNHFERT